MDEINYIVVGLGINVNIDHFPEDLSDKATSLQIEGGRKIKRAPLAAKVLECFEKYYDMFLKTEDLSMLQDEYNKTSGTYRPEDQGCQRFQRRDILIKRHQSSWRITGRG